MKIDIVFDEGHNYERIECSSISSTSDYVAFYDDNDCLIAEYNKSKIVGWNKVEGVE